MIPILDGLVKLGAAWMDGKNAEAQAKTAANLVKIQAEADIQKAKAISATKMAQEGQAQDYDLDRIAMEQMSKSWKDELVLVIFLAPMVMAFFPDLAPHALRGFEIIEKMPEWYRYVIIGMVIVIYGLRGMAKQLIGRKFGVSK